VPLLEIGGKGLFVKELEEALLNGQADIAVHSMKDVPQDFPLGLTLPVICERDDPGDAFVSTLYASWTDLPPGAVVGTSSLRRQSQLAAMRSDVQLKSIRGNVGTRLKKLEDGEFDALVLAAAGLKRLGLEKQIRHYFSKEDMLPAAGQGALGIECRANDAETLALIAPLNDLPSSLCVTAERAVCKRLGGNCKVPVAAFAEIENDEIYLRGLVATPNGTKVLRSHHRGALKDPSELGFKIGDELILQGAAEILRDLD